ncbi:MAG: ankyrin repeat domain-containing protein [Armatimonadetes bacterium]|nr:ankyrin repeat domain-containing protein [Armatimonadota bacterium]
MINLLLSHGAKITDVYLAAIAGDLKKVKQFVTARAGDINKPSLDGKSALVYAVDNDRIQVARYLIEHRANVNFREKDYYLRSPLCYASSGQMVGLLLANGARLDARDTFGDTPLHSAASRGRSEVARALITAGAKVDVRGEMGKTPLDYAAQNDEPGVAAVLVAAGADVNSRNDLQQTPLHYAALYGNKIDVARLLIENGADINAKDAQGLTPLDYAIKWGRGGIAKLIRDAKSAAGHTNSQPASQSPHSPPSARISP